MMPTDKTREIVEPLGQVASIDCSMMVVFGRWMMEADGAMVR